MHMDEGPAAGLEEEVHRVVAGEEGVSFHGAHPCTATCTWLQGAWWDNEMSPCQHQVLLGGTSFINYLSL